VDNRLVDSPQLKERWVRKRGLDYYTTGENHDYLSDEILKITRAEHDAVMEASQEAYDLLRATARRSLADPVRRAELGIPDKAVPLLDWSVANEFDSTMIGRFDFAGGFNDLPLKLIEFNADTASLMPETGILQPEIISKAGLKPLPTSFLELFTAHLQTLGGGRADTATVVAHMGHEDDKLNAEVLKTAANDAGWGRIDVEELGDLHFNPDEGLFFEAKPGRWIHYGTMIKFFPWDYALFEEPELFDYLSEMVLDKKLRVLNPAWTLLLQSKALMAHAWQDNPGHPLLLPTAMVPEALPNPLDGYVRKPRFGRTGDNVAIILGGRNVAAENQGHYGHETMVYQQLAQYNIDEDKHRYQLSTFQTSRACAVCCRRQDEWIIDDDGEFVPLALGEFL
jgi:glutathionylspermidine synthase